MLVDKCREDRKGRKKAKLSVCSKEGWGMKEEVRRSDG